MDNKKHMLLEKKDFQIRRRVSSGWLVRQNKSEAAGLREQELYLPYARDQRPHRSFHLQNNTEEYKFPVNKSSCKIIKASKEANKEFKKFSTKQPKASQKQVCPSKRPQLQLE
ncbi:hypothetical protein YC2023_112759 [Brassica napus]